MKLLQINYNNERVAVELVTYLDSCKGVSHVLESVQRKKSLQDQVQLEIGVKVQLQVGILG